MLFQTHFFLLGFLPVTLAAYYLCARFLEIRVLVLIIVSLVFYGWWDIRFVPLLLGQAVATWILAEVFFRWNWRGALWAGIAANLLILIAFKYTEFLIINIEELTGLNLPRAEWILPIGISFYTFELVSYLADQMRGHQQRYKFSRFLLFVLYFPRLIAGPIVRHDEIIWQFEQNPLRPGTAQRCAEGFVLLTIGLAKKVLIADPLSRIADPIFSAASSAPQPIIESWTGALAFSLQLYFDFSAYSDMAIGIAMMMGLYLPINFDAPYRATSIRDFWRRWHMTLSRYIRDYLYIPLGGSKHGPVRFAVATMVSMTICGLWHGAGWTFVAWGALHGVGLVACRIWQAKGFTMPALAAWALTMLFVLAGWVLFRSPDFRTALFVFDGLLGTAGIGSVVQGSMILVAGSLIALVGPTSTEFSKRFLLPWRSGAFLWVALWIYCLLTIGGHNPVSFIYFQF